MRRWLLAASALVALVGAVVTVIYFFQTWRRCDYEDTSVGCAMLPADANVMTAAVVVTLVAIGAFVLALRAKGRSTAAAARELGKPRVESGQRTGND